MEELIVAPLFWWLGLYLIRRDPRSLPLLLAGAGGLTYGAAIAADALNIPPEIEIGLALVTVVLWFGAVAVQLGAIRDAWRDHRPRAVRLIGVAVLFLALSVGGLLLHVEWPLRDVMILMIGFDGLLLAFGIAAFDAFELGESLRRDMLESALRSGGLALLFGGQAAMLRARPTLILALSLTAVSIPLLAGLAQGWLDRVIFARQPQIQRARAALRGAAGALPRAHIPSNFAALDAAEFSRLTRRALSAMNDLTKLSGSALLYLPLVDARLEESGAPDNVLERAAILKTLLAESVARLKPRDGGDFGATDAWRHYNALYWPYVTGLKPYSVRATLNGSLSDAEKEALAWFQSQVPERTLHNWQTAAARLVANDLREQMNV